MLPQWICKFKSIAAQVCTVVSIKASYKRWHCTKWWDGNSIDEMHTIYPFLNSFTGFGVEWL